MAGNLREGITTGTCATAAAAASVIWQISGRCPEEIVIKTPSGKIVKVPVIKGNYPETAVKKDAGDDPDVTDGMLVYAKVDYDEDEGEITFIGGQGIGTVCREGLKLPVGEPAINPVPRQMIEAEIRKYIGHCRAAVTIRMPGGEEVAARTFNPRLGIEGGLSILGTSGIVRPMSEASVIASLKLGLSVAAAADHDYLTFVLGDTGEKRMKAWMQVNDIDIEATECVLISNYMGLMLDEAEALGVKKILIGGFAGKLVKVAADIMNTHSHIADGRMETLCTFAALHGAKQETIEKIYNSLTVSEAMKVIREAELMEIWDDIAAKAAEKCSLRTHGQIQVGVVLLDQKGICIGKSRNVHHITCSQDDYKFLENADRADRIQDDYKLLENADRTDRI